jgi:hypothetical protein
MKKLNFIKTIALSIIVLFMGSLSAFAQNIGINATGLAPDGGAMLDISSTDKGLLIPRVNIVNLATIAPIVGSTTVSMLVYNTNATTGQGYYYWNGAAWVRFFTGDAWELTGNAGTNVAINFLGTTDNNSLAFRTNNAERMRILNTGNVGIGTTTPGYRLDLNTGTFAFGDGNVRTETRNDAGLQGNAGAQSGFFQTSAPAPAANWPVGANSWWHLIDTRHSNNGNNYALQLSGSFFDQFLYYRKTNGSPATPWNIVVATSGFGTSGQSLVSQGPGVAPIWASSTSLGQGFSQTAATACTMYVGNNTSTYLNGGSGACNSGYTSGTWFNVAGLSTTRTIASGNFVSINVHIRWKTDNYSYYAPETIWFRVLRDGVEIARSSMFTQDPDWYILEGDGNIFYYDAGVTAGSHTYTVQTAMSNDYSSGTESYWIQDGYLTIIEIH